MPTTNVNHNHKKLKQYKPILYRAMNSLRYILSHPLTSTNDLNEFDEEFNFMKENKITKLRKKPKIIRNSDSIMSKLILRQQNSRYLKRSQERK